MYELRNATRLIADLPEGSGQTLAQLCSVLEDGFYGK